MGRRIGGIALALAAIFLTAGALADPELPPPVTTAPDSATPLVLRPTKAIELSHEPAHTPLGWKLAAVAAVVGGAAFAFRNRLRSRVAEDTELTIVRRTAVGFRSELLVVNVEGQRLLLGVTPHSIQSLAALDGDDVGAAAAPNLSAGTSVGEKFTAMLDAADRGGARGRQPAHAEVKGRAADFDDEDDVDLGSQARGLLALRRPR